MTSQTSLGQKSVSLLAGAWLAALLNLIAGIVVARVLGPAAVGSLSFSLGLSGLAMAALVPGFAQAHMKRVAEGVDPGVCASTFGLIKVVLYVPLLLLIVLAPGWRGFLFETETLATVFALLFAGRVLSSFSEVFTLILIARERVIQQSMVLLAARGVRLLATVLVLVWAPEITLIAATFLLEGLVELVGAMLAVRFWLGIRLRRPNVAALASYWSYARPLLISVPFGMFQDSIDRVVVKQWAGLTAAGYYHVARGFWELLGALNAYPAMLLFTRMSALFGARSPDRDREARALFYSGMDKLLFVATPVGVTVWLAADPIIVGFFGAAFRPAADPVYVFALANLVATVTNNYTQVLYAVEAHDRLVPIVPPRALLYFALLMVLVPAEPLGGWIPTLGLGATGAALGRLFLLTFPAWKYVAWTREVAGVSFFTRSWLYVAGFAIGVASGSTAAWLIRWTGASAALSAPVAVVTGLAAYSALLGALHPELSSTLRYCLDLVSPARISGFLRREIGKS